MEFTANQIKERLIEEDYPNNSILLESVTRQILALKGEGERAFIKWFETKEMPVFEIEGISPSFLRKYHSMNDVAIILCYARLINEPKAAALLKRPVIQHPPKKG